MRSEVEVKDYHARITVVRDLFNDCGVAPEALGATPGTTDEQFAVVLAGIIDTLEWVLGIEQNPVSEAGHDNQPTQLSATR